MIPQHRNHLLIGCVVLKHLKYVRYYCAFSKAVFCAKMEFITTAIAYCIMTQTQLNCADKIKPEKLFYKK